MAQQLRTRVAPMMRQGTITRLFNLATRRLPMYCTQYIDSTAPAEMKEDPGFIAAVASFAVLDEGGVRSDRQINIAIQACGVLIVEADLPTTADTLERLKQGMKSNWASLPREVQVDVHPGEGEPAFATNVDLLPDNEQLARCLASLSGHGDHKQETIQLFTTALLAYIKQGNVSNNVMNKVTVAIRNELGLTIHLDPNVIRGIWGYVGPRFTADSAREMFQLWEEGIGSSCLRLRLVVQQAGWTGMTNYQNVLKARQMFPDFFWNRLFGIIPHEQAAFMQAMRVVGDDQYYGYKSDLGAARSTLYPSLAFCAYELLVGVGGDRSLRDFQGTNRNTPHANEVSQLVREYEARHREALLAPERANNELAAEFLAR